MGILGYVVGAGRVRLRVRMNTTSYTVSAGSPAPFAGDVISTNNRTYNLVTLGLNYKFGGW